MCKLPTDRDYAETRRSQLRNNKIHNLWNSAFVGTDCIFILLQRTVKNDEIVSTSSFHAIQSADNCIYSHRSKCGLRQYSILEPSYPANVGEYGELQIMPANGRWDLTRRLEG